MKFIEIIGGLQIAIGVILLTGLIAFVMYLKGGAESVKFAAIIIISIGLILWQFGRQEFGKSTEQLHGFREIEKYHNLLNST